MDQNRGAGAAPAATDADTRSHAVHLPALGRSIPAREDESLYAAARRAGVRIVGACGGRGSCGSCVVRIAEGRVHRDGESPQKKWVRACRVQARSDLVLEVAPRSLAPVVRADVDSGDDAALPLQPAVRALDVHLPPAGLDDLAGDVDRLRRVLPDPPRSVSNAAIAALPAIARGHDWNVSIRLTEIPGAGLRLTGVTAPGAPLIGLAVDLGTTNVAAFLVDLASGRRLASLGLENPQVAWGADLISRINHAIKDGAAAEQMRTAALTAIDALAHDLTRAVGAATGDIAEVVICGNTAMQHLLAGWPVAQLGRAPFIAATNGPVDASAGELGLRLAAGTPVHVAPGVGGFVGGDHVAALLATESHWRQPGNTVVMDIGTNTEISLVRHDGAQPDIWSASSPSGPALEGGHIASGMRAADGAIEGVRIEHGALQLQVIGGGHPVGLCGSGVLDTLAALVAAGWVDVRGRIAADHPAVATVDGVRGVTLAEEHADAPAVRFTQHDVRAVQLAKSAIRTATRLLAAEAGLEETDIDRFVIAGAFGAYIRVEACIAIGLLPALPRERFVQVGNAAGLGVQQMLSSAKRRARAARLAAQCRYVELSSRSDFQKTFLHHIGFAP